MKVSNLHSLSLITLAQFLLDATMHHRVLTEPDDFYETQIKWLIARGNQPEISKLLDVSPGYLLYFGDNYFHLYLKFNCNRAIGISFLQGDRAELLILFKLRYI